MVCSFKKSIYVGIILNNVYIAVRPVWLVLNAGRRTSVFRESIDSSHAQNSFGGKQHYFKPSVCKRLKVIFLKNQSMPPEDYV